MKIDNKLDSLKQIKAVDAPPFLLTRIRQKIRDKHHEMVPVEWKWTFAVISLCVLILNSSIFLRSTGVSRKKTAGIETVIYSMDIAPINDIYHE